MHRKGLLFAPHSEATQAILETSEPALMRTLGRQIPDFEEDIWVQHRYDIVLRGNMLKFGQNPALREQLLATGEAELVEASPSDRVWGIGVRAKKAAESRAAWGLNLLGKALMEVRQRLRGMGGEGAELTDSGQSWTGSVSGGHEA